jgi:hypothetical protein
VTSRTPLERSSFERVAEAVATARSVPGVAAIGNGAPGEPATFGPGTTLRGAAERDGALHLAVVADAGWSLPELAGNVRAAIGWPGAVHIEFVDIAVLDLAGASVTAVPDEPHRQPTP